MVLFRMLVKMILSIFYKVEVINAEYIPKTGSAIVCANHTGDLDMFFIGMGMKRFVKWMAKEELFKNPVLGALISWMGAFPVKRGKADIGSIRKAIQLIEAGEMVGIFPEGTRIRENNNKQTRAKSGAALLATKTDAVIVPVALMGKHQLFSKIRVVFGQPFKLDVHPEQKYTATELSQMSTQIMKKVYELMGEK